MEINKNKVLASIALVIVLAPLKLAITSLNIWFLVSAILILIVIYLFSIKPKFISSDKYYRTITEDIHDRSKENQEQK
jgi:hypothetical protein